MNNNGAIFTVLVLILAIAAYVFLSTHNYTTFIDDCVMHSTIERCNFIWEHVK